MIRGRIVLSESTSAILEDNATPQKKKETYFKKMYLGWVIVIRQGNLYCDWQTGMFCKDQSGNLP